MPTRQTTLTVSDNLALVIRGKKFVKLVNGESKNDGIATYGKPKRIVGGGTITRSTSVSLPDKKLARYHEFNVGAKVTILRMYRFGSIFAVTLDGKAYELKQFRKIQQVDAYLDKVKQSLAA